HLPERPVRILRPARRRLVRHHPRQRRRRPHRPDAPRGHARRPRHRHPVSFAFSARRLWGRVSGRFGELTMRRLTLALAAGLTLAAAPAAAQHWGGTYDSGYRSGDGYRAWDSDYGQRSYQGGHGYRGSNAVPSNF